MPTYISKTLASKPNNPITSIRVFSKPSILLAEFEQNLFKHKHWSSASQDGESLSCKQGIGNPSHGGSKQGFNCTLRGGKKIITKSTTICNESCGLMYIPDLVIMHAPTNHLLVFHLSKSDVYTLSNTPVNGITLIIQKPKSMYIWFLN